MLIKRKENNFAFLLITWQLSFSIFALSIASSSLLFLRILGNILVGINILQWFILQHDLGHNAFFKKSLFNTLLGHVASIFSLIPFYPWKNIHHSHHVWTGWKDLDPTHPTKKIQDLHKISIFFIDLCWKLWIPIFALSFSLISFWNLKKLKKLYPQRQRMVQHIISISLIIICFTILFYKYPHFMITGWLPGMFFYLMIADPLLLSQHTHIDYSDSEGQKVRPYKYSLQPAYTRSVIYPQWISKYILYNFDKHGLHHQYPSIPLYRLNKIPQIKENSIYWLKWLSIAKAIPATVLIFQSHRDTGINV